MTNPSWINAGDTPDAESLCDLVKEPNDLSCNVFSSRLFVVHDARGGCEDNVAELTRWKELDNPLLEICETDVVPGRDDTSLVETAIQLNDDLARAVVINLFELTNVPVLLHDAQELNNNLRARSD